MDNMSMDAFIQSAGVRMRVKHADSNPHLDDDRNPMDHWHCVLSAGRSRMTTYFSMGRGHNGREPETKDVLDCLASDAAGVENAQSFDDWCSEYGYDTDSRKAEQIYKACERSAKALRRLLGESAFDQLLFHTERL